MSEALSPLLTEVDGAVPAEAPDRGVAAHYGEPLREQRRLLERGSGFVDLSHRGVIHLTGRDRLSILHALTTADLEGLQPGIATTALVLSPQGRVEHAIYGVDDGEVFWAHVEPGAAAALAEFLTSMRFMMAVDIVDVTERYALVWEPAPTEPASADYGAVDSGTRAPVSRSGAVDSFGGRELFLPRDHLVEYAEDRGHPAGVEALEAIRVAAGVPRLGRETDHKAIPNEVGWLETAVQLDKGCYRGQETVARVHNLGRPPRRLTFLHFDGSADRLPAHGAEVHVAPAPGEELGRSVGFVTSSARHVDLGSIALALLKRNVPVDAELVVDGVPAAQEVLVDPDVGVHFRAEGAPPSS